MLTKKILMISTKDIIPNPNQPRIRFAEEKLVELAESIGENGMIQPIVVRELEGFYEIVAGERRFKAAERLKLEEVPCILLDIEQKESAKLAIIENIQREDLNIMEEALSYKNILEKFSMTQDELSKKIGKSRPYISNTIRLLELEKPVREHIVMENLSSGHGKLLLAVKDKNMQIEIAEEAVKNKLTVKQTKSLIDKLTKPKKSTKIGSRDLYIESLEEDLMMHLGTKVNLVQKKEKGIIEIEFYNEKDLGRILDIIS